MRSIRAFREGGSGRGGNSDSPPKPVQLECNRNSTVVYRFCTFFTVEHAKLDILARQLEKDHTVLDLTGNVKSACYHVLLAKRLREVSKQEVEALAAHKRDAELFYREGLIRPNDVLQAQVVLSNSIQLQEKAHARLQKAKTLPPCVRIVVTSNAMPQRRLQGPPRGALEAAAIKLPKLGALEENLHALLY